VGHSPKPSFVDALRYDGDFVTSLVEPFSKRHRDPFHAADRWPVTTSDKRDAHYG
jgi:hypothetical protein